KGRYGWHIPVMLCSLSNAFRLYMSLTVSLVFTLQIDITLVAHLVQQTRWRLKNRYLNGSPSQYFGSGENMTLNDFIQRHQKMDKREVKAEGVDSDGNPVTFEYELHERKIKGHETAGDVEACYELSLKFVREIDKELEWRMRDLAHLEGSKLFRSASYVSDDTKRVETFKKWLAQLHKMFNNKLPAQRRGLPPGAGEHASGRRMAALLPQPDADVAGFCRATTQHGGVREGI
ncbi:unnamed protein product, partial [Closterium sp. NIES-54]